MARARPSDFPDGAPMMFSFPPGLRAPPVRPAPEPRAETPSPPPIGSWIEDLVDDGALWQPGAGSETPVQTRLAGIDCQRLSRKLSQLQVAQPAGAGPGAPALAEPATVDCTRLSREISRQQASFTGISIGTVGHPISCSAPCEYVHLPGGCPDGTLCKKCHLCVAPVAGQAGAGLVAEERGPQEVAASSSSGAAGTVLMPCSFPEGEVSAGSRGHPQRCAQPCKYRKRKGGCQNGASCPDCHLCHWSRRPLVASSSGLAGPGGGSALPDRNQPAAQATPPLAQRVDSLRPIQFADQTSNRGNPLASEVPDCHFWNSRPHNDSGCLNLGSIGHPLCCGPPCKYHHRKTCKEGYNCKRCHLCEWHRFHARQPPGPPARGYQFDPRQHPEALGRGLSSEGPFRD